MVNRDRVSLTVSSLRAGRWEISDRFGLRANYTYTDSEQKSGADKGRPLGLSAKHMANATFDWQVSDRFNLFVTSEARSKRYRGLINNKEAYYKDYEVFHLGASYQVNKNLTINGRINNLLDEDFTGYETVFTQNPDGTYAMTALDDFNNKDKARNLWLSLNLRF